MVFLFDWNVDHPNLDVRTHSFPTRLSSGLVAEGVVGRRLSFPLGGLRLPALRRGGQQGFERTVRRMLRTGGWPRGLTGLPLYLVGGSWRAMARLDLELTKSPLAVLDQHQLPRTAQIGREHV